MYERTKLFHFADLLYLLHTDGYALLHHFCVKMQPVTHVMARCRVHLCVWLTSCWNLQEWLRMMYQSNSSNHSWTEWVLPPCCHVLRDWEGVKDDLTRKKGAMKRKRSIVGADYIQLTLGGSWAYCRCVMNTHFPLVMDWSKTIWQLLYSLLSVLKDGAEMPRYRCVTGL